MCGGQIPLDFTRFFLLGDLLSFGDALGPLLNYLGYFLHLIDVVDHTMALLLSFFFDQGPNGFIILLAPAPGSFPGLKQIRYFFPPLLLPPPPSSPLIIIIIMGGHGGIIPMCTPPWSGESPIFPNPPLLVRGDYATKCHLDLPPPWGLDP